MFERKEITSRPVICPNCNGKGVLGEGEEEQVCHSCQGRGILWEKIEITTPVNPPYIEPSPSSPYHPPTPITPCEPYITWNDTKITNGDKLPKNHQNYDWSL